MTVEKQRDFGCSQCGRLYVNKTALVRHINYECGKHPQFRCRKCGYRGFHKFNVERHLLTKHDMFDKMEVQAYIYRDASAVSE